MRSTLILTVEINSHPYRRELLSSLLSSLGDTLKDAEFLALAMASKDEKDALAHYTEKLDGFKAVDKEKNDTISVGATITSGYLVYCR